MTEDRSRALLFTGAVFIAFGVGAAVMLGLRALARPADFVSRLADVRGRVELLEASAKSPAPPAVYAKGAVCSAADANQIEAIEQRLDQTATGVTLTGVTLTPAEHGTALTPLRLSFEAGGSYENVVGLLGRLSAFEPQLFIDRLDLSQTAGGVQLSLSSKVYCWNDVRS